MVFWAQGRQQPCPDSHNHGRTGATFTLTKNPGGAQTEADDWLDQWYPLKNTFTIGLKPLDIKDEHVEAKSRKGWEKRAEQPGKYQTRSLQSSSGISKSGRVETHDQRVYSITSDQHLYPHSYVHARPPREDLSILNKIAKHILKLDNKYNSARSLKSNEFNSMQNKPKEMRDPTLPSPRNVEGALASPFYDPDFWVPRRPLAPNRVYHFHVIYNHAQNSYGKSSDTDLALRVTASLVEKLENRGYVNGYYHDRDRRSDQALATEMERVISGSSLTILLLTPGFVDDCLDHYLQIDAFRKLLTEPNSSRNQLVIMGVGVTEASLPLVLGRHEVLFFKEDDWETDHPAWTRLDNAIVGSLGKRNLNPPKRAASTRALGYCMDKCDSTETQNIYYDVSSLDDRIPVRQNLKAYLKVQESGNRQVIAAKSTEGTKCTDYSNGNQTEQAKLSKVENLVALNKDFTEYWVNNSPKSTKHVASTKTKFKSSCEEESEFLSECRNNASKPDIGMVKKNPSHLDGMNTNFPCGNYFRLTEHLLYADDLHNLGQQHVAWDPGGHLDYRTNEFVGDFCFGSENGNNTNNIFNDEFDFTVLDNSFDSIEFGKDTKHNQLYRLATQEAHFIHGETLNETLENIYQQRCTEINKSIKELDFENLEDAFLEDSTTSSVHTLDSLELDDMRRRYGFDKFRDAQYRNAEETLNSTFDSAHTLDSEDLQEMRWRYNFEEFEMDTSRTESSVCTLDTIGLEEIRQRYDFDQLDANRDFDDDELPEYTHNNLSWHSEPPLDVTAGEGYYNTELSQRVILQLTGGVSEIDNFQSGMTIFQQEKEIVNSVAPEDTRFGSRKHWQSGIVESRRQLYDSSWLAGGDNGGVNLLISKTPTIEELWSKWVECPSTETLTSKTRKGGETDLNIPDIDDCSFANKLQENRFVSREDHMTQDSQNILSLHDKAHTPFKPLFKQSISSENIQNLSGKIQTDATNTAITDNKKTITRSSISLSGASDFSRMDIVEEREKDNQSKDLSHFLKCNSSDGMKALSLRAISNDVPCDTTKHCDETLHPVEMHVEQLSKKSDLNTDSLIIECNAIKDEAKNNSVLHNVSLAPNNGEVFSDPEPCYRQDDHQKEKDTFPTSMNNKEIQPFDQRNSSLGKDLATFFEKEFQASDKQSQTSISVDQNNFYLQNKQTILSDHELVQTNEPPVEVQNTKNHAESTDLNRYCNRSVIRILKETDSPPENDRLSNNLPKIDFVGEPKFMQTDSTDSIAKVKEKQSGVKTEISVFEDFTTAEKVGETALASTSKMTSIKVTGLEENVTDIKEKYPENKSENNKFLGSEFMSSQHSIKLLETEISEEKEKLLNDMTREKRLNEFDTTEFFVEKIAVDDYTEPVESSNKATSKHTEDDTCLRPRTIAIENNQTIVQASAPQTKISENDTPQLNIVALNLAHEILTYKVIAQTSKTSTQTKQKEGVHHMSQIHISADNTTADRFETEKGHAEISFRNHVSTARDHVDLNEMSKTKMSGEKSINGEEQKQLLSIFENFSQDKEDGVSTLQYEDDIFSDFAGLSANQTKRENSLDYLDSAPSPSKRLPIEILETIHTPQSPVNRKPQSAHHVEKDTSHSEVCWEADDSHSNTKPSKGNFKNLSRNWEAQNIKETTKFPEKPQDNLVHVENGGIHDLCDQMLLNETSSLNSRAHKQYYNISNTEQIHTAAKNIVQCILTSSVNLLRTSISESVGDDMDQSKIKFYVLKETSRSFEDTENQNDKAVIVDDDENKRFGGEFDAESSFSEMQFRQASSPRTSNDNVCQESLPSAISSIDDILLSFETEEHDAGPLLLKDLQNEDDGLNVTEATNTENFDAATCKNQCISEPKNSNVEKNISMGLNARMENAYNGASLSPRYNHFCEGDSGFFDPCESTTSRDESEFNVDQRIASSQILENQEEIKDEIRSKYRTTNVNPSAQDNVVNKEFEKDNCKEQNQAAGKFKTNSTQPMKIIHMNSMNNNLESDDHVSTDEDVRTQTEKTNEEKDISSTLVESFYFREKALCKKEDLYCSDSQNEFRITYNDISPNLHGEYQPNGSNKTASTNRPGIVLHQTETEYLQKTNSTPDTENNVLFCDTGTHQDADAGTQDIFANQASAITVDETELNPDTPTENQRRILEELIYGNDRLPSKPKMREPDVSTGVFEDIDHLDRHHFLDAQSSALDQYLHKYASCVRFDQNMNESEQSREEPFRDIHVVGVSQEGIHRTLEQPCYKTDDHTQNHPVGCSQSPSLVSLAATCGTNPRDQSFHDTDDGDVNSSERLTMDNLGASFLSPRLYSPRMMLKMTPRSRSNFEQLRAMHRRMQGLQLTNPTTTAVEEGLKSNRDGDTSATNAKGGESVEQTKENKSQREERETSSSWLLGIYKGVCHTLAKPDMPYMG